MSSWHDKHKKELGVMDKLADFITVFSGSWTFIGIHVLWFTLWVVLRVEPFPYGLLTMIVSLEAIFLSSFILISQNRQAQRDRAQAEADYETNVAAKEEIEELQTRLARIEDDKLERILTLLEKK